MQAEHRLLALVAKKKLPLADIGGEVVLCFISFKIKYNISVEGKSISVSA